MSEAIVTIKLTESELKLLSESLDLSIGENDSDIDEKTPAKITLLKQLYKIEDWINEEKRKATIDKKLSEESIKGQTESKTSKGVCIPCDD